MLEIIPGFAWAEANSRLVLRAVPTQLATAADDGHIGVRDLIRRLGSQMKTARKMRGDKP